MIHGITTLANDSAASSTANVSSTGKGYFFAPTITIPATAGTDVFSGAANQVRAIQFVLPFQATVSKLSVNVVVADAVNTVADMGIYDQNGNRLSYTNGGISVATTGVKQVSLSGGAITLLPGVYYLAYCSTSGSATASCTSSQTVGNALLQSAYGNAANSGTAGVLPSTLGVISNVGLGAVLGKFEP